MPIVPAEIDNVESTLFSKQTVDYHFNGLRFLH